MKRSLTKTGPVTAVGTMSGTSLDGVDAAVLRTDGHRIEGFGRSGYRAYTASEQAVLREGLGQWSGARVLAATAVVEQAHLSLLEQFQDVDLIGFHGQTLAHAPRTCGTLQVGDGAALAQALGCPVAWDFRSMDVAQGGEGAPLAPFFHFACAKYIKATAPLVFLNLGGVGNITYVDPNFERPEEPGALLAFDTGPANAPLNDLLQSRLGLAFDEGGKIARAGQVSSAVVAQLLQHRYFAKKPPKSLDRNDFPEITNWVAQLSDADAAASLTALCVAGVVEGMRHCPQTPSRVLVTGGGRHNPVMMEMLARDVPCPVAPVEAVGLDGDMLEAQAFAYLAVRVARGLATSCPATTGVGSPVSGGTLSWPDETEVAGPGVADT
ncbi:Anhydro-N-acetylmuramic acid kinase [Roseobacter fucihabitans]|uniref:Anhydro-N-acetylmuramic acid kinase n=1 Tax=Roseobacter fucihabitans TaxID=1537242 RepID=A0ABZ2BUE7_9RHOB|nr:anhydro-N-acetylmuramic acid kinase [Roseobacter litoralis]MBC6967564.1 Anhydro-N-acetylmuramic acid kinase [Roseobacter litoralis]